MPEPAEVKTEQHEYILAEVTPVTVAPDGTPNATQVRVCAQWEVAEEAALRGRVDFNEPTGLPNVPSQDIVTDVPGVDVKL